MYPYLFSVLVISLWDTYDNYMDVNDTFYNIENSVVITTPYFHAFLSELQFSHK